MRFIIAILFVALVSSPTTTNADLLTSVVDLLKDIVNSLIPLPSNDVKFKEYYDELIIALDHAGEPLHEYLLDADRGIGEVYNDHAAGLSVTKDASGGFTATILDGKGITTTIIFNSKGFMQSVNGVALDPKYPVQVFTKAFDKIKAAATP